MNNRGFTLVELITTFALAAVLIVLLTNVVLIIKDIYVKYEIKTELLIHQADLYTTIYTKYDETDSTELSTAISSCGNGCYTFSYVDGSTETMTITNNKITFGDFVYKVPKGVTIEHGIDQSILISKTNNKFFIHINHPLYLDQDFGVVLAFRKP